MKRVYASIVALAALSIIAAFSFALNSPAGPDEWVNPGFPKAPKAYIDSDWFKRGEQQAKPGSLAGEVARKAGYGFVSRRDMAPETLLVQPNQLVLGEKSFDGYTFRYSDRIQLQVNPTDAPYDLAERLSTTVMTTTAGETHLWTKTSVRGVPAAFRKSAQQKWESGQVNNMPAVLEWAEQSSDGTYIMYTLLGDVPAGQLKAIAASLK